MIVLTTLSAHHQVYTNRACSFCKVCPLSYLYFLTARLFGDPHVVTLDGHKYTFNGKGEFFLVESADGLILQGRMVAPPSSTANQTTISGSVFSALVAKEENADTVQIEITEEGLVSFVNGRNVDFGVFLSQRYANVTLSHKSNNTMSASFSSGATITITGRNQIITDIVVTLPDNFRHTTGGLLGQFNGDPSDDLLPRNNSIPLPLNASLETIHYNFGLTCK